MKLPHRSPAVLIRALYANKVKYDEFLSDEHQKDK